MEWGLIGFSLIMLVCGMFIFNMFASKKAMIPEQIQLTRWRKIATDTEKKYQLSSEWGMPFKYNPMMVALFRRDVLEKLVCVGHAHASKNVLDDVDRIIATVEANHYAMDQYVYGKWVINMEKSTNHNKIYDWMPNPNERFQALWADTEAMLGKLNDLITYVRSIGVEGVNASIESAKVHLQVHLQDLTAAKEADAATAKELEQRPL